MIFETLAAMADYADDKKFNFSSVASQAKATLDDVKSTAAKVVVGPVTASGTMNFSSETLTVAGVTKVNKQNDWFNQHMVGLQKKTPRKVVEASMSNVVY